MAEDALIFTLDDVRVVRKISVNIDDFSQYAQEVQRNFLQKILGDKLYIAMLADLVLGVPQSQRFIDLVNGKNYVYGHTNIFRGVKLYCIYLWLKLYMDESAINITPLGARLFKDEFADNNEAKKSYRNASAHYMASAEGLEQSIFQFLKININDYPEFSESYRKEPAKDNNFVFKAFGRRYKKPFNIFD